jgi:xanthine dehydrogenase accessory factor
VSETLEAAVALAAEGGTGALLTVLGPDPERALVGADGRLLAGSLAGRLLDEAVSQVVDRIEREATGTIEVGEQEVFVEVIVPLPTMRIFGAGPIAEALAPMAAIAGFDVVVGDPRAAIAVAGRYPDAVTVEVGWPDDLLRRRPLDPRSFVVSLLHEARFEDALLPAVLKSDVAYLGALGSRKTHAARIERLAGMGFDSASVARIHGPIGLSIAATTPEEIAVSILAEVISVRRDPGKSAR